MYVLKTVGWVKSFAYSGRDYYYLPVNADPFEYSFIAGLRVRDVSTVKMRIAQTYGADANIGKAIRRRLIECRSGGQ